MSESTDKELTVHVKFLKRFRAIEAKEETVKLEKEALLRDSGWRCSSAYADCYWRWSKNIAGKEITTMDVDEALRLENRVTPCDEDCHHDD